MNVHLTCEEAIYAGRQFDVQRVSCYSIVRGYTKVLSNPRVYRSSATTKLIFDTVDFHDVCHLRYENYEV